MKVKPLYGEMTYEESKSFFEKFIPGKSSITIAEEDPDYYLIWNYPPPDAEYDPAKTLVFKGEPFRYEEAGDWGMKSWGEWENPDPDKFLHVSNKPCEFVWFLDQNVANLRHSPKKTRRISACLSNKDWDTGHKLRMDFCKFIDQKVGLHMYGNCFDKDFKNFKGVTKGIDAKDRSIFPYKYHIAFENCQEKDYFTEKIVDGILGECFVFYWGCPNIGDYINEKCFHILSGDFQKDLQTIKRAIKENWHEKKLPLIKREKARILNSSIMSKVEKLVQPKSGLKIAIYTICKNEEKFANRFMDGCEEADGVFVLDTGSSDKTVDILKSRGAEVKQSIIHPWRYDVPRNLALDMVPEDYDICVSVDLDEVLDKGWREKLEKIWRHDATRCYFTYYWAEDRYFLYDKIHARKGYKWIYPVHEILEYDGQEKIVIENDIILRHFPEGGREHRNDYYSLLEQAHEENPEDPRLLLYLAREAYFDRRWWEAKKLFLRFLDLEEPKAFLEEALAMRLIGSCCTKTENYTSAENWLLKSISYSEELVREPLADLIELYYSQERYRECVFLGKKMEKVERLLLWFVEGYAYTDWKVWDMLAVAAFVVGESEKAKEWGKLALDFSDEIEFERLSRNLEFYG